MEPESREEEKLGKEEEKETCPYKKVAVTGEQELCSKHKVDHC